MKMKVFFVSIIAFAFGFSFTAFGQELKDLGLTDKDKQRIADKAKQQADKKEFDKQQEQKREKSEAETKIDNMQKTKVTPIIKEGGGGVNIAIPTSGTASQK